MSHSEHHDHKESEVAVIGLAGRFPDSGDLAGFWHNLCEGIESIASFSNVEMISAGVRPERLDHPDYVGARGILDGVELFDAPFFGINPREAERTDPQHRLFLECAWEALESAAYDPQRFPGLIGVFAGAGAGSYGSAPRAESDAELDDQIASGNDYLPTRVSYKLDLRGPSVNVQTACSTSLVAVHLACQSLLCGECDLALAGGVWITVPQRSGYLYTEGGILSPDGHCRAFDAGAGGTVQGNGLGVVVLKRLPEALTGGDLVHAVIKGSAINNDGSSKISFTAPSVRGQEAVIREAHAVAQVDSRTITYVEAHGTGTALGDPIEFEALCRAFGAPHARAAKGPSDEGNRDPRADGPAGPVPRPGAGIELELRCVRDRLARTEARIARQLGIRTLAEDLELRSELDRLCTSYVYRFMAGAVEPESGATFARERLCESLGILPRFRRHYELFLRILAEDGVVRCEGDAVRFLKDSGEIPDPRRQEREIRRRTAGFEALLRLLRHCAESFDRSLTGEIEPVEVLYPDGTSTLVDACQNETIAHDSFPLYRRLLIRTLTDLVRAVRGKLRILEVGAGTGLLSWPLLDALEAEGLLTPERLEYHFTDVGRLFVDQARQRAAEAGHRALEFHQFDINRDPAEQGLGKESFHLLVGLNGVHVGRDVERTVAHLETLLAPGGLMLLMELTRVERWHHLIYSLAPGWWDFQDLELRSQSLLLEHDPWQQVMERRSFDDVLVYPPERSRRAATNYALILGRKPAAPPPASSAEPPPAAVKTDGCALGSVKTNIGHLGVAAGIAGLIKTVLALERGRIPPSLHFRRPNPAIDLGASPFFVNARLRPWPRGESPRRAGVSSFGIGGTNAHVIVEEAPERVPGGPSRPHSLLVLSARTATALETATANLAAHLRRHSPPLHDVAYTLQVGRRAFEHRRMLVCSDLATAIAALESPHRGPHPVFTRQLPSAEQSVVFLFPGQGSQHVNMGRELYETEPRYRHQVDRCCELLRPHLRRDLCQVIYPPRGGEEEASEELTSTALTQPALFVVEYALAQLWMGWGVRPRAMLGHSIGEYVAACLAGVLKLEDALALVALRGRLIEGLGPGAMLAAWLPAAELMPRLGEELELAAINAPDRCVVSGTVEAVETLAAELSRSGVEHRRLRTSHAFHSAAMEPILDPFTRAAGEVDLRPAQRPYLSNVTGTWMSSADAVDPAYWARHLRCPVRFEAAVDEVLRQSGTVLLEVGPGRTLAALVRRHPAGIPGESLLSSLPQPEEPRAASVCLLEALGQLWLAGRPVDWSAFSADERRRRVELPTYPFERRRHWLGMRERKGDGEATPADERPASRFYVPSWRRAPLLEGAAPAGREHSAWLVFADDDTPGAGLADDLRQAGREVTRVRRGTRFERLDPGTMVIDPRAPGDYRALFEQLRAGGEAPACLAHLWSLDGAASLQDETPLLTSESFARAQEVGLYSLLAIAQAWDGGARPLRLVVISNGMLEVSGQEALHPERAPLLAACRGIPWEYPGSRCRAIDVTPPAAGWEHEPGLIARLVEELLSEAGETVVAYRGRHRWVPDLAAVPLSASPASASRQRRHGVYLITDGLGDVGLVAAQALAGNAPVRLVVTVPGAQPPREDWEKQRVGALEQLGAEVVAVRADPGCADAMRRAIMEADERFGGIDGVVHAAGATVDARLGTGVTPSRTETERQYRLKVAGVLVLAELLGGRKLDFCLLASSLSPLCGRLGSLPQAAADVFLDTFAQHRNRAGAVPWISVGWDRWRFDEDLEQPAAGITPAAGREALRCILASRLSGQILVSAVDLGPRIATRIRPGGESPLADSPAPAAGRRSGPDAAYAGPTGELEGAIAAVWQELLGISRVGVDDNFFQLGGDSLLAIRLLSRLRHELGVELSLMDFSTSATVRRLAAGAAERRPDSSADAVAAITADDLETGEL